MKGDLTCLVTIHGIGFEQAPTSTESGGWIDGYADRLHQLLNKRLHENKTVLSDDPGRDDERAQRNGGPGTSGPVYVQSSVAMPGKNPKEEGLKRLGTWDAGTVKIEAAPLRHADEPIAHIALVYSNLEENGPLPGSAVDAAARAALSLGHYTSVAGLIQMAVHDLGPILIHPAQGQSTDSSLRVRTDARLSARPVLSTESRPASPIPAQAQRSVAHPTDVFAIVRQLEDDVAAYVCRNDLRERVRSFVRDALTRLASRPDVGSIVINSHSNGTVIAYDVLREFPRSLVSVIDSFLTFGSPLRKYADLFYWGADVGDIALINKWTNYYDGCDPVADPLKATFSWTAPVSGLSASPTDVEVYNIKNSPDSGLRAHDYWDNDEDVVRQLTAYLNDSVARLAKAPAGVI
jgi:hypothetical protein